ncbi:unnamed protein product [Sphenostylis stenocarpa]|uniref:Uncharacterized protein n=1 Tax=Sphenostylis stenocarpa TaxID=92480 RepID=A0AA86VAI6_9FABA|nr:unnamed protein product [Sphenostylis stenocarpa]
MMHPHAQITPSLQLVNSFHSFLSSSFLSPTPSSHPLSLLSSFVPFPALLGKPNSFCTPATFILQLSSPPTLPSSVIIISKFLFTYTSTPLQSSTFNLTIH